jgi:hypothetical protein
MNRVSPRFVTLSVFLVFLVAVLVLFALDFRYRTAIGGQTDSPPVYIVDNWTGQVKQCRIAVSLSCSDWH